MGVEIYKNGGKTVCDPFSLGAMLDAGWLLSNEPQEPDEKIIQEAVLAGDAVVSALHEDGAESVPEMTESELREVAKEKGIKNWWTKSIKTLREEMNDDQG